MIKSETLTAEQKRKKELVRAFGLLLAQYTGHRTGVMDACYVKTGHEECAELIFEDGTTKRVCVTADSELAVLRDMLAVMW